MRKILVGLVATTAVAAPIALVAAPANAAYEGGDRRPCVTANEWKAARTGMTKTAVHALFDTAGRHDYGSASNNWIDLHRTYTPCPGFSGELTVWFDNYTADEPGMRLYSKTRYRSW